MKGGDNMSKFMKFLAVSGLAIALFAVAAADTPSDQADGESQIQQSTDESAGGSSTKRVVDPGGQPGGV